MASRRQRPPFGSAASSSAGPATGTGLGEGTACLCKPVAGHAPRHQPPAGSWAGRAKHAFSPVCHLELPIKPAAGNGAARRGPAAPARQCPPGLPVVLGCSPGSHKGPRWMLSPLCQEGCDSLVGTNPLAAAGGPGMQKDQCHLARADRTLLPATMVTPRQGAGTPCQLGAQLLSWASRISSLIPLLQELHYPAPRQPLTLGQGWAYFQPGRT